MLFSFVGCIYQECLSLRTNVRSTLQENLKISFNQSENKFTITFEVRRNKVEKVNHSIKLIQNCEIKFISSAIEG